MKIAFVYDRINKIGGAERILQALHEIWPQAPFYTAVYSADKASWAKDLKIKTSFLQRIPFAKNHHEFFPNFTPIAFEQFDFSDFDLVLSITSAEAKSIVTGTNTLHVCYCLTPTRYLWSGKDDYENQGLKGLLLKINGPAMRVQDFIAAQRVDEFLAISNTVKTRIQKYYHRDSHVIYPPVNIPLLKPHIKSLDIPKPFYLVVSRLVPYKKIDIIVKAFNQMKKNLVIIGVGSDLVKLKKMAGSTIFFQEELTDEELCRYYMQCQSVIFASDEDFGIVPVEAQSFGKPVIAYQKGGATETLTNETAVFFREQTKEVLIDAVKKFESIQIDSLKCIKNAQRFSKDIFKTNIKKYLENCWEKYQQKIL
jgi:glycosyltransferase involved in cell wall biosynthesis